jgi:streptogramin lyase
VLEQAVYAGRNHTAILAVALATLAIFAGSARADDVAQVALGSEIESLVTGPDGGAWISIQRRSGHAIGRAGPAGGFRTTAVEDNLSGGATLGPDGQAWFSGFLGRLVRADAAGTISSFAPTEDSIEALATGPDGTLWTAAGDARRITRVRPDGVATTTPLALPSCRIERTFTEMQRASDGAVWIADIGCGRVIRVAPDGSRRVFSLGIEESPDALAADGAGGMWFSERSDQIVGHVAADGTVTRATVPDERGSATDVAAAPDGSAWFAFDRCFLGRLAPDGALTFVPAPIPARRLAFDPAGGLWLASAARLVHNASAGACDEKPPSVRVSRIGSLAALRRGIKVTVREPSYITASAFYNYGPDTVTELGRDLNKVLPRGATVTYRPPARVLRRFERALARGVRPEISFYVFATDREGNTAVVNRGGRRLTARSG